MQKVLIVGSPGAGKSVLARRLHAATGLPLHYLDCLWHRPDGGHVTAAEFDRALAQVLAQQHWIVGVIMTSGPDGRPSSEPYVRTSAACQRVGSAEFVGASRLELAIQPMRTG